MVEAESRAGLHKLITPASDIDSAAGAMIKRALQAVRSHLGMEVSYLSEFVGNRSVFREVDAPGQEALIKVGGSHSLDDVYCRHILEGRLPELIADTSALPLAMAMPITKAVPIGAHLSVPIRLPDGSLYGMFCCLGFEADLSLNKRDLQMMKAFAELTALEISRDRDSEKVAKEKLGVIRNVIDQRQFSIVYQPIWNIQSGRLAGLECLTRFSATPSRSPDVWFAEAAEVGIGASLEFAVIRTALAALPSLPADIYLSVNASPQTVLCGELTDALDGMSAERIVLEITEHASIDSYAGLLGVLQSLRNRGLLLAVDDAGAGYSSLQHILQLGPDLIKLDMNLTRDIHVDLGRHALASALIEFARKTGSQIIAEGVETASELATLRKLGIETAQGYFLGRPMPLESAMKQFNGGAAQYMRVA
jgi:EAL domain-containing protein (putative c-di-GMP-specific phosphodiesterase class I)